MRPAPPGRLADVACGACRASVALGCVPGPYSGSRTTLVRELTRDLPGLNVASELGGPTSRAAPQVAPSCAGSFGSLADRRPRVERRSNSAGRHGTGAPPSAETSVPSLGLRPEEIAPTRYNVIRRDHGNSQDRLRNGCSI